MNQHFFHLAIVLGVATSVGRAGDLRIGIIGLDTSHIIAFTKLINDVGDTNHIPGGKVILAYKGGSPDNETSAHYLEEYTRRLQEEFHVRMVDSVEALCAQVDAVLLESVDGRPHLEQVKPVLRAKKPVFVDKPVAGSLRDAVEIFRLAHKARVPLFSASSLRYAASTQAARNGKVGKVRSAVTWSPCHLEPHHPDLFWYGVHGVESLFTVMGPGIETVKRCTTTNGLIEVVGTWKGGRTGVYREGESYGGLAKGEKGEMPVGNYDGYAPLVAEIVKFFQTGVAPVKPQETIEIFAFMEAADESKRQGGLPVKISDVLKKNGWKE